LSEEGGEDGENIGSLLESMMSQLMSKDILYEPLKELDTKVDIMLHLLPTIAA
jgi:peroxin-19